MKWLSTVAEADEGEIKIEKMVLDENGYPQPTGEFETIKADALVLALGQETDLSCVDKLGVTVEKGSVVVNECMMTSVEGVFAGGDMVPGERNVTVATANLPPVQWTRGLQDEIINRLPGGLKQNLTSSIRGTTRMLRRPFARCWI